MPPWLEQLPECWQHNPSVQIDGFKIESCVRSGLSGLYDEDADLMFRTLF